MTFTPRIRPRVSTSRWRLRPPIFLPASSADRVAPLLGAFDALALEDGRRRRGLAAFGDAHLDPQAIVEFFPEAALAPGREVIEDGGLGRKVLGQHTPLTSGAVEIEESVENGSAWLLNGSPSG